jgi:branched-chain amino acid transport system substrate-binding protein
VGALAPAAHAQEVKLGFLGSITGPIAELVPPIVASSQLAVDEINAQGGILGGRQLALVVGDDQCTSQGAVDATRKLVDVDQVTAIVGALCSGASIAAANSVAIPAGVVMVSPSATTPEMTALADNDVIFRIAPSDSFQGEVLAKYVLDKGLDKIALTYINNDYGVGFANAFREAYTRRGGTITADQAHEPNKPSYRSELATLAEGDPKALVILAYAGGTGLPMIRQALEGGLFDTFVGGDGMRDDVLIREIGPENLKIFITQPVSLPDNPALQRFNEAFTAVEGDPNSIFVAQGYDSTMLLALAVEKAGSTDRAAVSKALREIANAPGEPVGPGEWGKAVQLLKEGKDIDYQGASGPIEFDEKGDVPGTVAEFVIEGDSFQQGAMLSPE